MTDTAVLVIDMLNTYTHPDAEKLSPHVEEIVEPLAALIKKAASRDDVELIYVNDNYGDFSAQFSDLVDSALDGDRPDLIKPIVPPEGSRRMTKVRHSAFYATSLAYLLNQLEPKRVILTGQVTEQCILYTALDAYVRHFPVVIPPDAVAHIDPELRDAALTMMKLNMDADIISASKCLD
ncbi:cysteine hydrolase family protein [Mycobacterium sp. 1274761.0]|uniref:cysteine hydrolase family protein n=1 Tax=Mycobacterium sp. 1274761.0 TaxID=1834077 RepID=UPI0007FD4BBC|nr:isochorismatase family cysteine hydrolase [Mycobacterium sp. 1274761.0]OBK77297.1 isochorismatase [Mycobacterium sp. 1274761.0]